MATYQIKDQPAKLILCVGGPATSTGGSWAATFSNDPA